MNNFLVKLQSVISLRKIFTGYYKEDRKMSGSNTQRVGEIFKTAGQAFNTLGQLTSQLESSGPNATKWTDQVQVLLPQTFHL